MPKTQPIANDGKMKRKEYEKELRKLQVELCYLQDWIKAAGARVIVVFEGRDAAGKGGTIKAIAERVSPRVFRVIALPAPSDRQKTQMFIQRYVEHFPAAGEIVIFDRSWYNRAGVERVMGFVSEKEAERFLAICPEIEKYITDAGIILIKFWLEVGPDEQERRFLARVNDPLRQWKLSPMDLEFVSTLVRLFPSAGHDAQGHRHGPRALAYCKIGRQTARAAQLHLAECWNLSHTKRRRGRRLNCRNGQRKADTTTRPHCGSGILYPRDSDSAAIAATAFARRCIGVAPTIGSRPMALCSKDGT